MRKLVVGLIAFALAAPIAMAGPTPVIDIDLARKKDGPWNTGFFRQNVGQETEDLFVRVINRDTNEHELNLTATRTSDGANDYRVRWFRGKKERTDEVFGPGSGYQFVLPPDERAKFEVTLKAKRANPRQMCLIPYFDVPSIPNIFSRAIYINDDGVCG